MSEAMVAAPGGGAEPGPWALLGGRAYCEALVEQLSRQFGADFVAIGDRRIGAVDGCGAWSAVLMGCRWMIWTWSAKRPRRERSCGRGAFR